MFSDFQTTYIYKLLIIITLFVFFHSAFLGVQDPNPRMDSFILQRALSMVLTGGASLVSEMSQLESAWSWSFMVFLCLSRFPMFFMFLQSNRNFFLKKSPFFEDPVCNLHLLWSCAYKVARPTNGIQRTPYRQWMAQGQSDPNLGWISWAWGSTNSGRCFHVGGVMFQR